MFFRKKKILAEEIQKEENNVFDAHSIEFGKSLLKHPMIRSASNSLSDKYNKMIDKEISIANKNQYYCFLKFSVGSAGITRPNGYCVNSDINVCNYRDFNISIIEDKYKMKGIAWALQSLIVPQILENRPEIIKYWIEVDNDYKQRIQVTLHLKMHLNMFQEL